MSAMRADASAPAALPFDAAGFLGRLRAWVECESPTFEPVAVERMLDLACEDLAALGAAVERIPGRDGFAGCRRARLPHARPGKGILVLGHLDTVHPVGTLAALPWRHEGARVYGPGIQDMKSGILLTIEALAMLARAGIETPLPVTVLLTPDEEVGSPSTRALIEAEAAGHRAVLVPEPATPGGGCVTGRYAIARFRLETVGRPSHAGMALAAGRSAIAAMARRILVVEAMTGPGCTFSAGVVRGGRWVNCVPTRCEAEVLSMAKRQADLDGGIARMMAMAGEDGGVLLRVERGATRPVWEPDAGCRALHARAQAVAAGLGFKLPGTSAGGGSDGNFTGAMGVPTLDGLGAEGAGLHTLEEHILWESLPRRARLAAGLLAAIR
jgi:glutamate carboxypeptidase